VSPFQPKTRQAGVDQAVSRVVSRQRDLRELDRKYQHLVALRAKAVAGALARGATLRELADKLGVTPEAVRKMAMGAQGGRPAKDRVVP
jgi:FixJ family two-component response regulator